MVFQFNFDAAEAGDDIVEPVVDGIQRFINSVEGFVDPVESPIVHKRRDGDRDDDRQRDLYELVLEYRRIHLATRIPLIGASAWLDLPETRPFIEASCILELAVEQMEWAKAHFFIGFRDLKR